MHLKPGTLWIVATPLGNSDDISARAKYCLEKSDIIYAEDTRRAANLFRNCGLNPRQTISLFEQNEAERIQEILKALLAGKDVALISDAGTPLLADPGYRLVKTCRQSNIPVSPVPGPFAPAAALSAAGLPPLPFTFLGFLPRGKKHRSDLFLAYASAPGSLVFFERKDRLCESLEIAHQALGSRELAICREMTKIHEEFIIDKLENFHNLCSGLLGELTVIIGPPEVRPRTPKADVLLKAKQAKADGLKPRAIVGMLKESCSGWTTRELYDLVVISD